MRSTVYILKKNIPKYGFYVPTAHLGLIVMIYTVIHRIPLLIKEIRAFVYKILTS